MVRLVFFSRAFATAVGGIMCGNIIERKRRNDES